MKKLFLFVFLFFIFTSLSYAANEYGCIGLTGGTSGALDAIDITGASDPNVDNLAEGDVAKVYIISGTTVTKYEYIFDASGTTAESSPDVIRPDDYTTAGNWLLISDGSGDLLADGTVPLTANWDVGAYTITGTRFISDIAIGTSPFAVTSTTVCSNLNADLLDGNEASAFQTILTNEAGLYAALSDVADFVQTTEINTAAKLETVANLGAYASDILAATSESNFKSIVNLEDADITTLSNGTIDSAAKLETVASLGAYASDILAATNEANFKSITNLEIGTDVQAYAAILGVISAGTGSADFGTITLDLGDCTLTLPAESVDSDAYVDGSIDLAHLATDSVNYAKTTGSFKSLTPVSGSTTDFASTFTGANLYGGTYVVTSDAGDLQLPLMVAGMNFTLITSGAIQVVAATNVNDGYMLDGVSTAEDNSIVNTSTSGDIAVIQYYTTDDWLITTNGWSTE